MSPHPPTSPRQTVLSYSILLVLLAIAAGVFLKQFAFNPALTGGVAAAGGSPGQAVAGQGATAAPATSTGQVVEADAGRRAAGPDLASFAATPLAVMSPPESFAPASLSDKIDGKAELYLSAGVASMICQRFKLPDGDWMEVFAYDMGAHRNAFAVYSAQQRPGAEKLDLGQFSYRSPNGLYMVAGRWYVEIVLASTSAALGRAMETLAGRMAASLSPADAAEPAMDELALFPREHLVPDSISLSADFGVTGFSNVFVARYDLAGRTVTTFLSRREDPRQAAALAKQYVDFFVEYGATAADAPADIESAAALELFGIYKIVFPVGPFVAGVHEAPSAQAAASAARMLHDKLAAQSPIPTGPADHQE